MRTATSSPLGPVPREIGWVKNKGKGMKKEKGKEEGKSKGKGNEKPKNEKFKGCCNNCIKWCHNAANCWHGKEKHVHQVQGNTGTASLSSLSPTLTAKDVGTEEMGLIESVSEDAEESWLFMVAESVAINQLSMDCAHSLVVDFGA